MLTDDEAKSIVYELCEITSDQWQMTDHAIDILDKAERYIRNGGKLGKKDKQELEIFYKKYPNRKLDI